VYGLESSGEKEILGMDVYALSTFHRLRRGLIVINVALDHIVSPIQVKYRLCSSSCSFVA
jgi:hypothetical protein